MMRSLLYKMTVLGFRFPVKDDACNKSQAAGLQVILRKGFAACDLLPANGSERQPGFAAFCAVQPGTLTVTDELSNCHDAILAPHRHCHARTVSDKGAVHK